MESVYCVQQDESWTRPKWNQLAGELQLLAGRTGHHPLPYYSLLRKSLLLRMADPALEAALEIKLKGNVLFKENNFEEAIKLYSQAIDACPKHRYV